MVVQWFANRTDLYLSFATELRAGGPARRALSGSADEDGKKVGDKQFKYASARGIPFVAVIGADELANDTVTVKNMKTGQQVTVLAPCGRTLDREPVEPSRRTIVER